jgi:hypothetical protein
MAEREIIEQIYYSSGEYKLVELIDAQADIYEYLAGNGDDSKGIELAKKYSKLINDVNSLIKTNKKNEPMEASQMKFNPVLGEQLLERISSRL